MSKNRSRRWIFAVLLAILFPAFAFHASCVAVLGPGNWGSGMEEKVPEILDAESNPAALRYQAEFAEAGDQTTPPVPQLPPGLEIPGKTLSADHDRQTGQWVVQTYEGERWIDQQHFYLLSERDDLPRELNLPTSMIFENPRFIQQGSKSTLALERWNSWYISPTAKLRRYARSWFDETLRPERSLYLCDLETRAFTYFSPGHTFVVSPDATRGAFLRSGATSSGFYSLHIWDFTSGEIKTVLSLHESDPGSGRSFDYRWSADSRALHLSGSTAGFERRNAQRRDLNHVHIVGTPGLYGLN
ncbi:MAG: hypothetical protein O2968_16925 [Acidobacteria bacterium]|nr:hypothetical protein [Acidobacteriota bacterium]